MALIVFGPWMARDWLVFGNPLPGQAAANALSVTGFDIFAWSDPPTLARYLAVGLRGLVQMRIDGFTHNLFSVLLVPSFPIGLIGLLRLPWTVRHPGAPAAPDRVPADLLDHDPGLPGGDHLGHLPARGRRRSTSC